MIHEKVIYPTRLFRALFSFFLRKRALFSLFVCIFEKYLIRQIWCKSFVTTGKKV